ncbi:MAG: hypothetical protein K6C05_04220 [Anaerovibrio sp.]|uniref:hypothetical protein n=1 Tax=Anaerovibrio sp. TaxID=1872532 RepID=UPI0025E7010B|nr:hypothetical protein [Anaerovibrio sp.]MCR5176034.1 hypothetical protein [Anaerovibrio sp.]
MKKKLHIGLAVVMSGVVLAACNNAASIPEAPSSEAETTAQAETLDQEMTEAQSDTEEKYVAIDISDCKDFKQAIAKLTTDMGYAEVKLGNQDTLLVTAETFGDDGAETREAIIADVYCMDGDDKIQYCGSVSAGGTATPLAVSGNYLYAASHHSIKKYTVTDDGVLAIEEEASEKFDSSGNATYYLHSDLHDVDADENGGVKDDSALTALNNEYFDAKVIEFTVVK